jgi:Spy/CpxP family protein refolding chaperone
MKNFKAVVGIMLIFLLGGACGAIVTHMAHQARQEAFVHGDPAAREAAIVKRLTRKLDLDQRQQEQVKAIIHENHVAMQEVRRKSHPQIEAILDQGQKGINAILRPEQQAKFQQIIAERKERRNKDFP